MNARFPYWVVLLAGAGLFITGVARAELYKWVDDDGNVTYSQLPPPDRQSTKLAPPPPPPEAPPATTPAKAGTTAAERAQQEEDAMADKEIATIKKKNCEISKRNLDLYKTFNRIRDEKGEVTVLDDATRAAKIKEAEKDVESYCK